MEGLIMNVECEGVKKLTALLKEANYLAAKLKKKLDEIKETELSINITDNR